MTDDGRTKQALNRLEASQLHRHRRSDQLTSHVRKVPATEWSKPTGPHKKTSETEALGQLECERTKDFFFFFDTYPITYFSSFQWHPLFGPRGYHIDFVLSASIIPNALHGVLSWLFCADSHSTCVSDSFFRGKRGIVAPHRLDNSWPIANRFPLRTVWKARYSDLCNSYYVRCPRFVRLVEHFRFLYTYRSNIGQIKREEDVRTTPLSPCSSSSSSPS